MNSRWNHIRNFFLCRLLGCRFDKWWYTPEQYHADYPNMIPEDNPGIKQCSRCGFAEHHGKAHYR